MLKSRGMGAARGGNRYAEGGTVTVADRIRKMVGMPTGQRGKQLEQQEQDILKPPAPPPKK